MAVQYLPSITGLDAISLVTIDPTPNGLSISSSQVLSLALSSTSTTGALSSTDWNTFNNKQAALTLGNITDVGTDGITITGGTGAIIGSGVTISQHVADTTHNGYLSSTDWNTFNGKQASGNYITALTGDVTASGPGSVAATLATVNANVGSFTNASITVNAKGLITAASSGGTSVTSISVATANGFAGSSSGGATPALTLTTTITGLLKGNGTAISAASAGTDYQAPISLATFGSTPNTSGASFTSNTLTLQPADGTNPGGVSTAAQTFAGVKTFSSAPNLSSLTASRPLKLDASKNVTAAVINLDSGNDVTGTVGIINGGTGQTTKTPAFNALAPTGVKGDIIVHNGTNNVQLAVGANGTFLKADSGTSEGVAWATTGGTLSLSSKTTTYTITTSDDNIVCSNASFTLTLPTAVGNSGKIFEIVHNGTSLTQLYTIATVSSQTIYGGSYSATTYILYTVGERLKIQSDGTNWLILQHDAITSPASYTPTKTGTGTVSSEICNWRRNGKWMTIDYYAVLGTTPGSVVTSWTIPSGLTIDTSILSLGNTTANPGHMVGQMGNSGGGDFHLMVTATGTANNIVYMGTITSGSNMLTPTTSALASNSKSSFTVNIPITEFNP